MVHNDTASQMLQTSVESCLNRIFANSVLGEKVVSVADTTPCKSGKQNIAATDVTNANRLHIGMLQARAAAKEETSADAAQPSRLNSSQPEPVAVVPVDVIPVVTKRAAGAAADEAPHKVKKQKSSTAQPGTTESATGQDTAELEDMVALSQKQLDKIKWKQPVVQVLKNSKDSSMKLSKLQKQLRLAAQVSDTSVLSLRSDVYTCCQSLIALTHVMVVYITGRVKYAHDGMID